MFWDKPCDTLGRALSNVPCRDWGPRAAHAQGRHLFPPWFLSTLHEYSLCRSRGSKSCSWLFRILQWGEHPSIEGSKQATSWSYRRAGQGLDSIGIDADGGKPSNKLGDMLEGKAGKASALLPALLGVILSEKRFPFTAHR